MQPKDIETKYPEIWSKVTSSYELGDSAIPTIKMIREATGLGLIDAKRIYIAVSEDMTLESYQQQIWDCLLPLLEELEDHELREGTCKQDESADEPSAHSIMSVQRNCKRVPSSSRVLAGGDPSDSAVVSHCENH